MELCAVLRPSSRRSGRLPRNFAAFEAKDKRFGQVPTFQAWHSRQGLHCKAAGGPCARYNQPRTVYSHSNICGGTWILYVGCLATRLGPGGRLSNELCNLLLRLLLAYLLALL